MRQPKIVIFIHDGRGLGHLRRLTLLAKYMEDYASILFITGHRDSAWMVPKRCEFIHIPSLDSIDPRRSRQWGRREFIEDGHIAGRQLREDIINATIESFHPDALITDYLPLGISEEMKDIIFDSYIPRKYFIARGILGEPAFVADKILFGNALTALRDHFNMVLVMSDHKIIDVVREYKLDRKIAEKITYTGYASESVPPEAITAARNERLRSEGDKWVVCSAGGGKEGEALIERCWEISQIFPECCFDIVVGPRSRLGISQAVWYDGGRVRLVPSNSNSLPLLHAAADIVICRGGYNSLMEACRGNATILCMPIESDYEQIENVRRLNEFRPIVEVTSLMDLDRDLDYWLAQPPPNVERLTNIDLDGLQTTSAVILADLAMWIGLGDKATSIHNQLVTT